MIEHYTFRNIGGSDSYQDIISENYLKTFTAFIYYGSSPRNKEDSSSVAKLCASYVTEQNQKNFEVLSNEIESYLSGDKEYLLIRLDGDELNFVSKGGVYGYIVRGGELFRIPNGTMILYPDDQIVCATTRFFSSLSLPAIITDALMSLTAEEWMDNMIYRISEKTRLIEGNLSAITIVRTKDDDIRIL